MREMNVPSEIPSVGAGATTRPLPPDDGRRARLVLRLTDGSSVKLDRTLKLGQSSRNDVVIRDETVSRLHCTVEMIDLRVLVRDEGSTNGTFVNGMRITSAELRSGVTLTVGSTRMRVVVDADASKIIGESRPVHELRAEIAKLAAFRLPVLIRGETGTGKELVALALHEQSGRTGQFVPVNCGSIPKDLVESELFGHERGAFTGATHRRPGVFQEADGGTLFLDEVGELPLSLQTRLLRVLETHLVRPVGASRQVPVNVRVIAATHLDLEKAIRTGRFRADLYFRLVGAAIHTPPLRHRKGDIPLLARRFLDEMMENEGACTLSDGALEAMEAHPWPGNVRELRHVLQRAIAFGSTTLYARDLCLDGALQLPDAGELVRVDGRAYQEIEKEVLLRTVERHGGNHTAAALALGIPKSTLCDKVKRYRHSGKGEDDKK